LKATSRKKELRVKVLYISYWSLSDPLTEATVLPNLKILKKYCASIHFATIERNRHQVPVSAEVIHIPYHSLTGMPRFIQKISDVILVGLRLFFVARRKRIDTVICRGSMAAIFGVFLNRLIGLPFLVESFEPHADYMAEGNTWRKSGIEFRFQKWIESQCLARASFLMPVSQQYAQFLVSRGVSPEKIEVMPCCVDTDRFRFSEEARVRLRAQLQIPDGTRVGIYVGKFGDLYLREEAFNLFRLALDSFKNNFFLIVLSPQDDEDIRIRLSEAGFQPTSFHVARVENSEVPSYLSAADFAFSLARPAPNRKYLSPVKNGEYWASGLPILISETGGDDDAIAEKNRAGVIFEITEPSIRSGLDAIREIISNGRNAVARNISPIAEQYRGFRIIEDAYERIFSILIDNGDS
jgi:glycosyltransferase involved in cell wall biosynthesis